MRRLNHLIETQIRYWLVHEEHQEHEMECFLDAAYPALTREGEPVLVPVLKQSPAMGAFHVDLPGAIPRF